MRLLSFVLFGTLSGATLLGAPVTAHAGLSHSISANGDQISVQTTGDVTFDLTSDAIFDLHDTGTLQVSEKNGSHSHFFFASSSEIVYQVNGVNQPFDDTGKAWLRMVLSEEPPPPPPPPTPTP